MRLRLIRHATLAIEYNGHNLLVDPMLDDAETRAAIENTPNQRKNLIEDLNETGFADPRNLTAADLPLIESRIALIEQVANDAMDDVNSAAFDEAYKDLLNMRARLVPAR